MRKHHLHSPVNRALYVLVLIGGVLTFGTIGMHCFESMSYLDAFYFVTMLATAQGPIIMPATVGGKLFACFISFVSVTCVITSIGLLFGPLLGKLFHIGARQMDEEITSRQKRL